VKLCTTPQSNRQNCLLAEWSEEAGPFAPIFLLIAESKISIDSFQPTYQFVLMGSIKVALKLLHGLPHDTNIKIPSYSDSRRSPAHSKTTRPRSSNRWHRHLLRYSRDRGSFVCIPRRLAASGRRDQRDVRARMCHETILQSLVIIGYSFGRRLSHPKARPAIFLYLPKKFSAHYPCAVASNRQRFSDCVCV